MRCWIEYSRCLILFSDFLWNIEGVHCAAIFDRFFCVGERVSVRGAVKDTSLPIIFHSCPDDS